MGCGALMLFALDPLHPVVPVVVWAARALTFFNVLVLLWLGLTVLLNAERRSLGTWLTGGGLLLGGACSVARASALARGFSALGFARLPAAFLAGSSALAALAREARFTVRFWSVAMSPV